jgi:hypothetical protein
MKVFNKTSPGPAEKTVIMGVREGLVQPFDAGAWLDLRIGFLLSICSATDGTGDDVITGLAEDLGTGSGAVDKMWIGVRNNGTLFPGSSGVTFIGWSNGLGTPISHSKLISSDAAIGTTNSDYWRAVDANDPLQDNKALVVDNGVTRNSLSSPIHMVQNFSGGHAAGYATLLLIRMTRPNVVAGSPITTTIKWSLNSGDVLFTSTPTKALLQTNMIAFPGSVQTMGPTTLSVVPDSLFLYWPFTLSRLRMHCMGVETIA